MPTAFEIAQVSGTPFAKTLLAACIDELPVISSFDAREIDGDRILSLAMTALPTGSFLNLGEAYPYAETETALGEYNASRIGGAIKSQVSTETKWNERNRASIGAGLGMDYFTLQAVGRVKGQMRHLQRQIFLGVTNDAKGFPGLKALTPFSSNTITITGTAQDSDWEKGVLNVAGTTATTASSIYSVTFGEMDCQLCLGGPGGLANFLNLPAPTPVWIESTDPVDSTTRGDWYNVAAVDGYVGLSVMGGNEAHTSRKFPQYSVRRAANVTADSGKTCTDTVLQKLVSMHPDGHRPSVIYMSYRSREQLQASRTPTSTVYVGVPLPANSKFNYAPVPTEFEGIPIVATDAIGNTDAIES